MNELVLNNCRLDRRYDIHEHLGRGSYAEIFLANDILASPQSPHRQVVIKALNVFLQDDLDADLERTLVENFRNEAVALDRVRHPNIISRLGHGTARDLKGSVFHYIVLEYLAGGDMQQLIRRRSLPLDEALGYIEQVCSGIGHAHRCGVIHRDIKPQNLLLSGDLVTVKIADFGVARFSAAVSPVTKVGTNVYAPPEHSPLSELRGNASQLTPAADVYSLAKTVYTILTGESPREFANAPITKLPEGFQPPSGRERLLEALTMATADDPADRYATVEEFWAGIAKLTRSVEEEEYETVVRVPTHAEPQPHVSRGYTPIAPEEPQFDTQTEPRAEPAPPQIYAPPVRSAPAAGRPTVLADAAESAGVQGGRVRAMARRRASGIRRAAVFAVTVTLFAVALYGTASYMRGRGVLPAISLPFASRTAVASTDVYLRPTPGTEQDPIGLVTKNSKVKIVNSQNNWYQVDVIEQGRSRPSGANATRGWLNGKYLEITEN